MAPQNIFVVLSFIWLGLLQECEAIKSIQCNGWSLKEPENSVMKCDQAGEVAIPGSTSCKIICSANYAASEEIVYCPLGGAWAPTTNPECIADGSVTTIVVPAVLGSLFVFIFLVFIFTRLSNVCQKKTRDHEDEFNENYIENGQYTIPRAKKVNKVPSYKENVPDTFHAEKEAKRKISPKEERKKESSSESEYEESEKEYVTYAPKTKKSRFAFGRKRQSRTVSKGRRKKIPLKDRIKLGFTTCFRRVHSWGSSSGPKRVVGRPGQIGVSSICGDMDHTHSSSSYSHSSSESDYTDTDNSHSDDEDKGESPYLSADQNPSLNITIANEKIVQTGQNTLKSKKSPPPRPPQPSISQIKLQSKVAKTKKRRSSGYSSDEGVNKKKQNDRAKSKNTKRGRNKDKKSKSPHQEASLNPYNHYPVAGSDRQYMDFEHDYRKSGHIYEGGAYHPQYHPVESFPIKPVKPSKKDKSAERKRRKEKRKAGKNDAAKADDNTTTGGVKYYSITPDKEEYKKKSSRRSRSSGERDRKRKEKRSERKRERSSKERKGKERSKKKEESRDSRSKHKKESSKTNNKERSRKTHRSRSRRDNHKKSSDHRDK